MGFDSEPPSQPNFPGLSVLEGKLNEQAIQQQLFANRPTQYTPWGTSSWWWRPEFDPASGATHLRWSQNIELPPESLSALEAQRRLDATRSVHAERLINQKDVQDRALVDWDPLYLATPRSDLPYYSWDTDPRVNYRAHRNILFQGDDRRRSRPPFRTESLNPIHLQVPGAPRTDLPRETWQGMAPGNVSMQTPEPIRPNDVNAFGWGQMAPNQIERSYYQGLTPNEMESSDELRSRTEQAVYDRMTSRLDPQWEQMGESLESQLWNQGLRPGDEAYDEAMDDFNRRRTDAYQAAQNEAVLAGREEAESQFGMGLTRRQQAIQEARGQFEQDVARRGLALGERERVLGAEMARRELMSAEYGREFEQQMLQRGAAGAEYEAEFNREMERRRQEVAERGAEFERQLAGRQAMTEELRDVFQRELARRQQGEAEFGAEFAREAQFAGLSMDQAQDVFNRELARRQQLIDEYERRFGMQMTQRQQVIAEELQKRGFTVNEINSLLSGAQVGMPNFPGFQPAGRAQAPGLTQAATQQYRGQLDAYNAEQMRNQGIFAGLTGLAGAGAQLATAFGFSDRRLKTHVKRIGTLKGGIPFYGYRLLGIPTVGVMADEVPETWTTVHSSGFLMVDYSKVWNNG